MSILALALLLVGGALAFEGFAWAVAPDSMKEAYRALVDQMDSRQLALVGLAFLCIGLVCIVFAVSLIRGGS